MTNRFRIERILEDLGSGDLDSSTARRRLASELGDCDCITEEIRRVVRDAEYHNRDAYEGRRKLERAHDNCELDGES